MNVLAYVEAILRGPKGGHRRCRWLRVPEYIPGSLVPVTLPELLQSLAGDQLVTLTVRVTTPRGWGVCLPAPSRNPLTPSAPFVSLGGPLLPKTGDVLVAFAPVEGWFEVAL
jgi:hypothetical protein